MTAGLTFDLFVLVSSFSFGLLLISFVRRVSSRAGRVAQPRQDRWHSQPTPVLGGIGIFGAFIASVLIFGLWSNQLSQLHWSLLAASLLMFGVGLYDDIRPVTPPAKLLGQILAASIVVFSGDVIEFFHIGVPDIILTFVWLVGITNAINLLDNMDGLAGGVSLIAACILSYFFWRTESYTLLLISLSLAGSILGFLIFNFPPAKIFMGDSGSLFLGFTLAALAIARKAQASNVFAVMGVPTLLFLLPILDTALVTITRLLRGQSPAQGGTDHTSHRLIAFGLSERQALLVMYGVALVSGITGAALEALDYDLSLVLIPILLISLSLLTAYLARLKVVSGISPAVGNFTRLMVDLTYKRRVFEMILDFFLISVSYYLAFWTRYGLNLDINSRGMDLFVDSLPVAMAGAYLAFFIFGVYRGVWRYTSIDDLIRYGVAAIAAALFVLAPLRLMFPANRFPTEIFVLYGIILLLGLAASRSSFQILDRIFGRQQSRLEGMNVLIYGAEDAGEMALRWILRNPELGYRPVGFLDDDPHKWRRSIHGVDVLGGGDQIESILNDRRIDGVIVTSTTLLGDGYGKNLVNFCHEKGVWVRLLRLDFELIQ